MFEIGNEVDFVLSEAKRLRSEYPAIVVAPMIYRVEPAIFERFPGFYRGVVVARAMWAADEDKRRAAMFTAKLLRQLGVVGAVLGFAHGGHAVTDTALTAEACERAGIAVATMMFEMAGDDGTDFSLVQRLPSAEPLVSTGNIDALLSLPPVDTLLGGNEVLGVGGHAASRQPGNAALLLPVRHVFAAATPSGNGRLAGAAG